ncbi:terminase small subunit [Andreesenia angusta]|uniref:Terminase small subunit n=1 Tax=Andreesenia angusta TaxID=39480 RepID=A0A1S1V6Y3_9FIRM|nr:terminase small subunit [Andreesenia angusta]OHW62180.1 terminase small subunit [Andreesenia angusta]
MNREKGTRKGVFFRVEKWGGGVKTQKFNEKQRTFITEYLKDKNATQAAIRAGYSEKTAYSQGQRLLKKVEIKSAIDNLLEEIRESNIAEAKEIEEFLSLMMRGEIQEDAVVVESLGDFESKARIIKKQASAKDRIKAAELLGKRYGIFTDKLDVSGELGVQILDDIEDE